MAADVVQNSATKNQERAADNSKRVHYTFRMPLKEQGIPVVPAQQGFCLTIVRSRRLHRARVSAISCLCSVYIPVSMADVETGTGEVSRTERTAPQISSAETAMG
jgi:hypothetical protein